MEIEMTWHYRTILFEFTKDSILGEKYLDDEEMEKALNQLGAESWELVNVTLLQDGVLAFLKKPGERETAGEEPEEAAPAEHLPPIMKIRSIAAVPEVSAREEVQDEYQPIRGPGRERRPGRENSEPDFIGGIKIS
jgi:hypothetical protein